MQYLLRIDCSPRGGEAHSVRMADELVGQILRHHPGACVVQRNLAADPPPLVDADFAAAMRAYTTRAEAAGVRALAVSEQLIGELEAADVLCISTPMHNYSVPAPLKAWIDQVVRFGRTFRPSPAGKVGLLADRPTFLIVSSGGYFLPPRALQPDHLTGYMIAILATMGIRDVTLLPLEALTRSDADRAAAYAVARERLAARLPL